MECIKEVFWQAVGVYGLWGVCALFGNVIEWIIKRARRRADKKRRFKTRLSEVVERGEIVRK